MSNTTSFKPWDNVKFKGNSQHKPFNSTYVWGFFPGDGIHKPYLVIEHPEGISGSKYNEKNIDGVPKLKDTVRYLNVECDREARSQDLELISAYVAPAVQQQHQDSTDQGNAGAAAPSQPAAGKRPSIHPDLEISGGDDQDSVLFAVRDPEGNIIHTGFDREVSEKEFNKYSEKLKGDAYMRMVIDKFSRSGSILYSKKQGKFIEY